MLAMIAHLPKTELDSGSLDLSKSHWQHARHVDFLDRHLVELAARRLKEMGYVGLIIEEPPRHGKSELSSHFFPAWYLGTYPDHRVMLASYEATFAASWGRKTRDTLDEWGPDVFGVSVSRSSRAADEWNIEAHRGGMTTAGVGGAFTGRGANLLIVDDPVKNNQEAQSETVRNNHWNWWTTTVRTRLEPDGIILVIGTRWHEDDLIGRIIVNMEEEADALQFLRIRLPAIAEDPDDFDDEMGEVYIPDALGREPGEPLWPERYDLDALRSIRADVNEGPWFAMYQQRPTPLEGGLFKKEHLSVVPHPGGKWRRLVRWWDMAATDPKEAHDPDWTVGLLMGEHEDGRYYVLDVARFRESPGGVERELAKVRDADPRTTRIRAEQEPGAMGKMYIYTLGRKVFRGRPFRGIRSTGNKMLRAEVVAGDVERGSVLLVRGPWNRKFIQEVTKFPNGAHDDQVDAFSGAHSVLTGRGNQKVATW